MASDHDRLPDAATALRSTREYGVQRLGVEDAVGPVFYSWSVEA